jgi:hypothetical protein
MPPWQRQQLGGFFLTTTQRIQAFPCLVSLQSCLLDGFMMKKRRELYHTSNINFASSYETTRQPRLPDLISESHPISAFPNFTTPQLPQTFTSPYIVSYICRSYHSVLISHHARPPRAVYTSPNCISIYIHYPAPPLLRLHAPTGRGRDEMIFS